MSYMYNFTLHEYVYKHVHIHSQKHMHIHTYDNHTWRNHFLCTCIVFDDYGSGISCNSQWFAFHDNLRQRNPQQRILRSHSLSSLRCRKPVQCWSMSCSRRMHVRVHGAPPVRFTDERVSGAIVAMRICGSDARPFQRSRKRYPNFPCIHFAEEGAVCHRMFHVGR